MMKPKLSVLLPALTLALILAVHAWFVTYGTWDFFFQYEKEERSDSYDDLARNLLRGSVEVSPKYTDVEAFYTGTKTVMYFGPWPALLRIPLHAVFPGRFGEWARVSCLAADFLILLFFLLLINTAMAGKAFLSGNWKTAFRILFLLMLGFASPLLYLMACPYIYHESILWAWTGSTACVYFLFRQWQGGGLKHYAGFGTAAALIFLTRPTFAFPFYLFTLPYAVMLLWKQKKAFLAFALPFGLLTLVQLWYNYERWGNPLELVDYEKYWTLFQDPKLLAHFKRIGDFRLERIPINLDNYFGMIPAHFSAHPPFIHYSLIRRLPPDLFLNYYREWTLPLQYTTLGFIGAAFTGMAVRLRGGGKFHWKDLLWICLAVQILIVLAYFFVTQRYIIEAMPFLMLGTVIAMERLTLQGGKPMFYFLLAAFIVSGPLNVLSTFSCLIDFQWGAVPEWRAALKNFFY